jgi:hypothetical protein
MVVLKRSSKSFEKSGLIYSLSLILETFGPEIQKLCRKKYFFESLD